MILVPEKHGQIATYEKQMGPKYIDQQQKQSSENNNKQNQQTTPNQYQRSGSTHTQQLMHIILYNIHDMYVHVVYMYYNPNKKVIYYSITS